MTAGSAGLFALLGSVAMLACSSDDGGGKDNDNATGSGGSGGGGGGSGGVVIPPAEDVGQVGPTESTDWTMLGYDLGSTYWNRGETKISPSTVGGMTKKWEVDVGGNVTGAPVVLSDRVFVMSGTTGLFALSASNGGQIWARRGAFDAPDSAISGSSSMTYEDGRLYVYANGDQVFALDANDGTILWQHDSDPHPHCIGYSSPIVAGDLVLVGGSGAEELIPLNNLPGNTHSLRGFVLALNKSNGTLAWKKYTVDEGATGSALWSTVSVDIADGVVFAATGNNYRLPATDTSDAFLAIDLATGGLAGAETGTGEYLWKAQFLADDVWSTTEAAGGPDYDFGANPVLFEIDGRKLVAGGSKGGDAWVLDRTTGQEIERRDLGPGSAGFGGVFNTGAFDGERLIFASNGSTSTEPGSEPTDPGEAGTSVLFALDPLTLDVVWERQVGATVFSPITVANGVGFYGRGATLEAFDTATGEKLFQFATEGTIASAPSISDGRVVFGSGMTWFSGGAKTGTKVYMLEVP